MLRALAGSLGGLDRDGAPAACLAEVRLDGYSAKCARKERGIVERCEAALTQLHAGAPRLGPAAQRALADPARQRRGALPDRRHRDPPDGSLATHPGVFCLRSSETDWDADAWGRTSATRTAGEAVCRSLPAALGGGPQPGRGHQSTDR